MKKLLFFTFIFASIMLYAEESDYRSTDIVNHYKIASPEEKRAIDSMFVDFELETRALQVKSICNVDFGMTRDEALDILQNKYGSPMHSNDLTLSFKNVKYAGVDFDSVHFLFQSDGKKSYLSTCIFVKEAKDVEKAAEIVEMYHSVLSQKYTLSESISDNGFKIYGGGVSPLWDGHWFSFLDKLNEGTYLSALRTDVIEYDSELVKQFGNKYGVRIIYGPYEFVKEEF